MNEGSACESAYLRHVKWFKHTTATTITTTITTRSATTTTVIFNRGSAEPLGSASVCQGFCSWPVKIT